MIIRTLGKILRGSSTPFQLLIASLLAGVLGFLPGWWQAPGLIVLTTLLLVILNANLPLAGLVAVLAKLLSLVLAPVSFAVGRHCLDGPLQPFFQKMINAPVLAWFGFEYYLTTGGFVLGLALGIVVGLTVIILVHVFRWKMSVLERGSPKFQQFTAKRWVKIIAFIFVGGGQNKFSQEELLTRRVGNPIRPLGLVFAGLVLLLAVLLRMFASDPIVQMALQHGLEKINGATVDLADADLSLKENRLTLTGLALADPNALDTDLFRAVHLQADLSGVSLLRKRAQIDRVIIREASHGEKRAQPGQLTGRPSPTSPPTTEPGVNSIDDYLRQAKLWKQRLAQVKRWLDKLSGPESDRSAGTDPRTGQPKDESLPERLAREIRQKGYAKVQATHLIAGKPTLTITELAAHKVRVAGLTNQTLDITASNLSTHPKLLGKTPQVTVRSTTNNILGLDLLLGEFDSARTNNRLQFFYRELETDRLTSQLKLGDKPPVQGGTLDLQANGQWSSADGIKVNLPVQAALHNTTFILPGIPPTPVETFTLPFTLQGPLDNPRIRIDNQQLASALLQAGLATAKSTLTDKAKETLTEKTSDKLGETSNNLLDGLIGSTPEKKP